MIDLRPFRLLNAIDAFKREALGIEADFSRQAERLIWMLEQIIGSRGTPRMIRMTDIIMTRINMSMTTNDDIDQPFAGYHIAKQLAHALTCDAGSILHRHDLYVISPAAIRLRELRDFP